MKNLPPVSNQPHALSIFFFFFLVEFPFVCVAFFSFFMFLFRAAHTYGPARSFFFDLFIYLFFCAKKENIADWAVDKAMYQYICMVCKCIVMLQVPPHYLFLFFFGVSKMGLLRLPIHTTRDSKGLHRNAPHWQKLSPPKVFSY